MRPPSRSIGLNGVALAPAARRLALLGRSPDHSRQLASSLQFARRPFWKAAVLIAALTSGGVAFAQDGSQGASPVQGRWDAVLSRNGVDIPFRLDIKGDGPTLQGVFFDGWTAYDGTTSATFKDDQLTLKVDHYLATISAKLDDGKLAGSVVAQNRETTAEYAFSATRHVETTHWSIQ